MIHVTFRRGAELPAVQVDVADGKEIAVLARACERVYPGPADPKREMEREAGYRAALLLRAKTGAK